MPYTSTHQLIQEKRKKSANQEPRTKRRFFQSSEVEKGAVSVEKRGKIISGSHLNPGYKHVRHAPLRRATCTTRVRFRQRTEKTAQHSAGGGHSPMFSVGAVLLSCLATKAHAASHTRGHKGFRVLAFSQDLQRSLGHLIHLSSSETSHEKRFVFLKNPSTSIFRRIGNPRHRSLNSCRHSSLQEKQET